MSNSPRKPNLILFVPDSYRGDVLRHRGNPGAVTPHVDALASDGVSFTQTFAQNPVCTPSRCSFMTGHYPHVHGHRSMTNMLKPHEPHLLKVLIREGYHVFWSGKNDLASVTSREDFAAHCHEKYQPNARFKGYRTPPEFPEDDPRSGAFYRGVMTPDPEAEYRDGDRGYVQGAIEFVKNWKESDPPFCLFIPLILPHPVYLVEGEFYDQIDPQKLPQRLPNAPDSSTQPAVLDRLREIYLADGMSEADWIEVKRVYYGMCTKIDDLFGQLMDSLKARGLYDSSLITFFSDHGDYAGDYSLPEKTHCTLHDALIHVPFILKPPAGTALKPGNREHLTELLDITATIYDLLEIEPGYPIQGISLRDSIASGNPPERDAVFAEVGARRGEEAFINREVANRDPKDFYSRQSKGSWPAHREGSYAVTCRTNTHKLVRRPYSDCQELYDLTKDPGELHNVYSKPEYNSIRLTLEERLLRFYLETGDVLPHEVDSRQIN